MPVRIVLLLLWVQCFVAPVIHSQPVLSDVVEHRSPRSGKIHLVTGNDGSSLAFPEGVKPDLDDPYQALRFYGDRLGIRHPESELEVVKTERCSLGLIHHTFQQVYLGVEVFTGVVKVHLHPDGTLDSINGEFHRLPKKLSVTPTISVEQAVLLAEAQLEQDSLLQVQEAELLIVNPGWWGDAFIDQPVLAHHLVLEGVGMLGEHVLIDARSGHLVDHWPAVHSALFREVYDGSGGGLPGSLARSEGSAASGDLDIDEAYDTSGDFYRLLNIGLGRDSLDGNGVALVSTVHWNDGICPNAIWNGSQSAFCNGLATDDVIAHEFAHGLTAFTANLVYQNQPGQLNEAYSDIFGEVIDLWNGNTSEVGTPGGTPWPGGPTGGGQDTPNNARTGCADGSTRWKMGEQTSLGAIRDMWFPECFSDPPSTTDPLYNQNACGPFDNGGVHIGSGVFNHSFAMLVDGKTYNGQTVSAIGMTKATAVYFRALTVYMTSSTAFPEAETFINQAATDLLNSSPIDPRTGTPGDIFSQFDADQVAATMLAVGMSELVCGQVPPGPPPSNDECSGSIPIFIGLNDIDSNNATTGGPPADSSQCSGTFLGDVGNDIWYSYTPPADGTLSVSTCDIASWDTDLLVYEGDCGSLLQIACNGDTGGCSIFTSQIDNIPVVGGLPYRIRVASWNAGTTGTGQLDVSFVDGGGGAAENCTIGVDDVGDGLIDCDDPDCATSPACLPGPEDCSNGTDDDADGLADCDDPDCFADPACAPAAPSDECASALPAILGSNALDTTTATQSADPYDTSTCPGTFLGDMTSDVWYLFTPDQSGDYLVSTCDTINFDSDIVVYSGNCGSLSQIGCNGDSPGCGGFSSQAEVSLTGGTTYTVRVGGWNAAASGTGTLEISTVTPPPPPENCSNGTDDDLDGLTDCEDPDCIGDPACVCDPVISLSCSQGAGTEVSLSWINGESYSELVVSRDGVLLQTLPGSATSTTDGSASLGDHVYTVTANCGGNQQAPAINCAVTVEQTAGFSMSAQDVAAGYTASGSTFSTTVSAREFPDHPGFPTNTAGFSFGLGHDPDLFEPVGAAAAGAVADLDGGNGPEFFQSSIYPTGITVGCVYSFSFAETIQMISDTELVTVDYGSLPGVFDTTTGNVVSALDFTEALGTPGVDTVISTDGGLAVGVITSGATVILSPTGFMLTAVDQTVGFPPGTGAASFETSITLEEDPGNSGYPSDTQGFSFGVSHDPSILTVVGGGGAEIIENLNNGTGADFLDISLFSDGFTCGCVYSFLGTATIQFATTTELVTASYETVPAALIGETADVTTVLSISNSLGSPPVQLVVVVNSGAQGAVGIDGSILLTPQVGGFVRGDTNGDSLINLADAITLLDALFLGGVLNCLDAADTNDDELSNIADGVFLLTYLFSGGPPPPPPFGGPCGADPAGTALDCAQYNSCN